MYQTAVLYALNRTMQYQQNVYKGMALKLDLHCSTNHSKIFFNLWINIYIFVFKRMSRTLNCFLIIYHSSLFIKEFQFKACLKKERIAMFCQFWTTLCKTVTPPLNKKPQCDICMPLQCRWTSPSVTTATPRTQWAVVTSPSRKTASLSPRATMTR